MSRRFMANKGKHLLAQNKPLLKKPPGPQSARNVAVLSLKGTSPSILQKSLLSLCFFAQCKACLFRSTISTIFLQMRVGYEMMDNQLRAQFRSGHSFIILREDQLVDIPLFTPSSPDSVSGTICFTKITHIDITKSVMNSAKIMLCLVTWHENKNQNSGITGCQFLTETRWQP